MAETPMNVLQSSFDEFRRSKSAVHQIHKDALECFKNIEKALSSQKHGQELANELAAEIAIGQQQGEISDESMVIVELDGTSMTTPTATALSPLSEILYTQEEQEKVGALFAQNPALIVVGQTNSGKSSIINEILRSKIVTTSDQPCTSRIVKLTYSQETYVHLVRSDGKVLEKFTVTDGKVPRELIELKEGDRENTDRVTATVEAGFDIPFLKAGVDVIDSPGRDENKVLDKLVRDQLKFLPFIVYVIDGHNLFTALDKSVLQEIKEKNADLDIFFIVNKIEPQEEDSSGDEDDDDDDDDEDDDEDEERVQDNKKRRVFEQLVKNGFLNDDKPINDQEYFHGLSAWKLFEYRLKKKKKPSWNDPNNAYKEYIEAFGRFQACLEMFSGKSLKASVRRSCQTLISVLSRCLFYFIEKANHLKQDRDTIITMLNRIQDEEKEVHINVARQMVQQKSEIIEVLKQAIQELQDSIQKEAREFQYGEEFKMRDGYVKGKEAVNQCRKQIQQMVVGSVYKRIKETLLQIFKSRDDFFETLGERVKAIEQEATSDENTVYGASTVLYTYLIKFYEVDAVEVRMTKWNLFKRFTEILTVFLKQPITTLSGKVKVGDPTWKADTAVKTLNGIDTSYVANELIKSLNNHFEAVHEQFEEQVKNIIRVVKRGGTLKDDQRRVINSFAPDVASLEMLCHSVNDNARFGRPQPGEMIGAGAQGNVFTCKNIVTPDGKPCVVKVVPVSSESLLKDLTLELHTTRSINHPNILPVLCTNIQTNASTGIVVSIVSERMKCDLQNALKEITSLRTRLQILLDVAKALQYLHQKGLMHRDVKLQNVLVDENNRAYLTDFGLCKPEGLVTGTLVGTPVAMAPEMIAQQYNKSVDVYAFGILMWRVCEGKGNQPENIFLFPVPLIMLAINAKEKRKPERKDCFLPACWELMEKCWGDDPTARPSFDIIVKELEHLLANKSII